MKLQEAQEKKEGVVTREEFEMMKEWMSSIAQEVNKIASWADWTADKLNDRFEKLEKPEEDVKLS